MNIYAEHAYVEVVSASPRKPRSCGIGNSIITILDAIFHGGVEPRWVTSRTDGAEEWMAQHLPAALAREAGCRAGQAAESVGANPFGLVWGHGFGIVDNPASSTCFSDMCRLARMAGRR